MLKTIFVQRKKNNRANNYDSTLLPKVKKLTFRKQSFEYIALSFIKKYMMVIVQLDKQFCPLSGAWENST